MILLSAIPDAPWLPPLGRAEVYLAEHGDRAPEPVSIVRLLVASPHGAIFCVPRSGGRPGLDLPAAIVADDEPLSAALNRLLHTVFGTTAPIRALGHIRNTVPLDSTYEWPTPIAHFTVHQAMTTLEPVLDGT
ncbi:NUDIX hydrolase [Antribacter gilvus]|uniref:NUDIX hydrolase n=1 Tax=Antribacter gilvus TaxID=2304675 RepID=UPI000F7796D5|nr:NUDIX hydrolase [Antribacter gilvus]